MAKKRTTLQRMDIELAKQLKDAAKVRYFKNLAKKEPSMAEMTHLLTRTNGYRISLEELKIKPKKEDR